MKNSGQLEDHEGEYQVSVCHVPPDGTSQSVRAVKEGRSHNPWNQDYYMNAVQEGYAGLRRADQQQEDVVVKETVSHWGFEDSYAGLRRKGLRQEDTVVEEAGHDQSLSSHPGPADEEGLTLEDEA